MLTPFGLKNDRRWMIIDENNRFVTQRLYPELSQINLSLENDLIHLIAKGMIDLSLPISLDNGPVKDVKVWKDVVSAIVADQEANQWISQYLGRDLELVYMPESTIRKVDPEYAQHQQDQVSFADGFQYLLISEASLNDLNDRLSVKGQEAVPMNRFRPNIVVSGCDAFAEDQWSGFATGNNHFLVVKPCSRCVMTTVDSATGTKGTEPLKTLLEYRKQGSQAYFGQNVILDLTANNSMHIAVGDQLDIISA